MSAISSSDSHFLVSHTLGTQPANDNAPERWVPIPRHTGYEVSDQGRVRHGSRLLASDVGRDGYLRISLRRDGEHQKMCLRVHLLVAAAFLGPCPEDREVDHVNGNKADPRLGNLEHVTHSENMLRALARGQWVPVRGERHGMAKLNAEGARAAVRLLGEGFTTAEVGARIGVAKQTVSQIRRGEIWGHVTGLPRLPRKPRRIPAPANSNATEGTR